MNKAITSWMLVLSFVLCAKVGLHAGESGFTTGTSVEKQSYGLLDVSLDDDGGYDGPKYWKSEAQSDGAVVMSYDAVPPPYDYEAMGTAREEYLDENEPGVEKFLALDLDGPLDRLALSDPDGVASNVFLMTSEYDGVYADTLVKFSTCVSAPDVDWDTDRIVVWMKETAIDGERSVTNLMVTAGRFAGDYRNVEVAHYTLCDMDPPVEAGKWCRLTIRVIPDVTEYRRGNEYGLAERLPGFTVYLDGKPAVADANYDIGVVSRPDRLSPESRVLISEHRLFPCIALAASNKAVTLSRLSFAGLGAADDIVFTTDRPAFVQKDNVFTLNWDAGIVSTNMICVVSNASAVVTNEIDTTQLPRYRDFTLGTNNYAQVTVTNVVFDTLRDYSNGVWSAEGDCTVSNNVFTYNGMSANPIGYVASSREVVGVGTNAADGCSATFAEAKALAKQNNVKTILLMSDVVISSSSASGGRYSDNGSFQVSAGDDLILDLNGHTLTGNGANATVTQSGGMLRITDSSDGKTGRIEPSPKRKVKDRAVVWVRASAMSMPTNVIDAGWYDGTVVVTGQVPTVVGTCFVEGGAFTNIFDDARHFYLERCVTNSTAYFGLVDDYWTLATNGFIWCGMGSDSRWDNKDNWQCKAVPGEGDLAIFRPADTEFGWNVDFGDAGVATKNLWMDEDIVMSGTNDFTDVNVISGAGRFNGMGQAEFTGRLPGMLTDEARTDGEIRLGGDWGGIVRISDVSSAQELTAIMGWGNARSKVEFNGVRGYLFSRRQNYKLPYGLILTDYVFDGGAQTNTAWNNEMGYTGSTVSFPTLSGSGTFASSRIRTASSQLFEFYDVERFAGKFNFRDKRLLLGTGSAAAGSKPGDFTFSNDARVRSELGWSGVNAHFGTNLVVYGELKQELMSYDAKERPAVGAVVVTLIDPSGKTNSTCRLRAKDGKITVISGENISYEGQPMAADDAGDVLKAGSTFEIPAGSAVTIVDNKIIANGVIVSTFAEYYKVMSADGSTYSVAFDEETATPTLADVALEPGENGTSARIRVENVQSGLWYGLQTLSSLAEGWDAASAEWKHATGDTVTFETDATGSSSFFRVIVTDVEP